MGRFFLRKTSVFHKYSSMQIAVKTVNFLFSLFIFLLISCYWIFLNSFIFYLFCFLIHLYSVHNFWELVTFMLHSYSFLKNLQCLHHIFYKRRNRIKAFKEAFKITSRHQSLRCINNKYSSRLVYFHFV